MKIAILGTGAVGGYYGARLAEAGNDVTFLARGKHYEAIRESGLDVKSQLGNIHIRPAKVVDSIKKIGKIDLVVIGVKAWQVKEIASELTSLLHSETTILPLQNGILAGEELRSVIDKKHILGGLCKIFCKIQDYGVIHHFGVEPFIVFGEFTGEMTQRVGMIKALFDHAGIASRISGDIEGDLWKKFIPICTGGLLAVTHTTYGELRGVPGTRKLMCELLEEIYLLSRKLRVKLKPDLVEKIIGTIDNYPFEATTSMARDVWEGKPSEIEYQNGTVVRLGEKYNLPTPVNRFVYYSILSRELKARQP